MRGLHLVIIRRGVQYTYYVLNVDDKFGVANKEGNIIISPEYDEVQIPNHDQPIFVVKNAKIVIFLLIIQNA